VAFATSVVDFGWPQTAEGEDAVARIVAVLVARGARAVRAVERPSGRVYLPPAPADAGLEREARALPGAAIQPIRVVADLAGASSGAVPAFHYVVETDVLAAQERDFNAWYDEEHLAGLAGVPGTIRAVRYVRPGASPRYGACYDLAMREAYGSPAWLAVRATAWSSRVRPAFRNTTRTMYRVRSAAAP
jgi:hypothetical protein